MTGKYPKIHILLMSRVFQQGFLSIVLLGSLFQFSNVTLLEEGFDTADQHQLSSMVGPLQNQKHTQKKLYNMISLDLLQTKSLHQDFGTTSLNHSVEAHTKAKMSYAIKNSLHFLTEGGFSYSKQDIVSVNHSDKSLTQEEKMFYGSVGLTKGFLKDLLLESKLGLVRCRDYSTDNTNFHPTGSVTLYKVFNKRSANASLSIASEGLGGGGFTGIYGNQMFHHARVGLELGINKKIGLDTNIAFGQTRDAFEGSQKANVIGISSVVQYKVYKYVQMGIGLFHRSLVNEDAFSNPTHEGTMVMATMKISYF